MNILTRHNLEGIAQELNPNCEITRHVVKLIYKDGGMQAVDAYVKTFKPVDTRIKRYERVLKNFGVNVCKLITKPYTALK